MQLSIMLMAVVVGFHEPSDGRVTTMRGHNNKKISAVKQNHRNVTLLLDTLLSGYDKNLRPNFGGQPVVVEIDFNIRSMGPISEVDMTFSMDCYFRQSWIDKRLELISAGNMETMTLGISTLEKIWKPDTYFFNGRQSYLHTITVPNRFVRIDKTGRILYSQRLTIKASCPMNLANFPIDTQQCPLQLGSFAYSVKDVVYSWNSMRRVVIAADMKMSQFDLISSPSENDSTVTIRNAEYSTLSIKFYLQRHTGYFLIQVYAPCILLVILSWVAFWLNREATGDRVALGVTTVLTMTFVGLDNRNDLPKVSYSTALDSFMGISFVFVFATIMQFAIVHYFTKRGSGEVNFTTSSLDSTSDGDDEEEEADDEDEEEDEEEEKEEDMTATRRPYSDDVNVVFLKKVDTDFLIRYQQRRPPIITAPSIKDRRRSKYAFDVEAEDARAGSTCHLHNSKDSSTLFTSLSKLLGLRSDDEEPSKQSSKTEVPVDKCRRHQQSSSDLEEFNSVSKIDSISRILFPVSFIVTNIVYCYIYLSKNTPHTVN